LSWHRVGLPFVASDFMFRMCSQSSILIQDSRSGLTPANDGLEAEHVMAFAAATVAGN
jgi:hypothetical protein